MERAHQRPARRRPGPTWSASSVTDAACNTGRFPALMPPPPGSTPHAGVTVRYLAAEPPLTPVAAGSRATVYVDARSRPYRWSLWRVGARKPSGHGRQRSFALRVKLPPAQGAGLYHLVAPLRRPHHRRAADRELPQRPAAARGCWSCCRRSRGRGRTPSTIHRATVCRTRSTTGGPIQLDRVLADGLPPGFADEAAFLAYLDKAHLRYDLTTDLALIDGTGPTLAGAHGRRSRRQRAVDPSRRSPHSSAPMSRTAVTPVPRDRLAAAGA